MKPAIGPTLPATISIPPFIAMPARVDASPRTTTVPARIEAATALPALPSITTVPSRMLSPAPQPAPPWTMHGRAVVQAGDVIADAPFDRQAHAFGQGHAQIVPRGRTKQADPVAPAAIAARIAWLIARTGRSAAVKSWHRLGRARALRRVSSSRSVGLKPGLLTVPASG